MDRSFSKYNSITTEEILRRFKSLADIFEDCGGLLTLLWHNFSVSDLGFLGYEELYLEMLRYLKEKNFYNNTPENIAHWLDKKKAVGLHNENKSWILRSENRAKQLQLSENGSRLSVDCESLESEATPL